MKLALPFISAVLLVAACGAPYHLRQRAGGDMNCGKVEVDTIHSMGHRGSGPGRFRAHGCGREADYLCWPNGECIAN